MLLLFRYEQSRLPLVRLAAADVPSSQEAAVQVVAPAGKHVAPASAAAHTPPLQLVAQFAAHVPPHPLLTALVRQLAQLGVQPAPPSALAPLHIPATQLPVQFASHVPPQPSLTSPVRQVLGQFGVQLAGPALQRPSMHSVWQFASHAPPHQSFTATVRHADVQTGTHADPPSDRFGLV